MKILGHKLFNLKYIIGSVFALLLLTSYLPNNAFETEYDKSDLEYVFKTSGSYTDDVSGEMIFKTTSKKNSLGENFITVTAEIKNVEQSVFSFLISKKVESDTIEAGVYKITYNNEESVYRQEGALGFFNIIDSNDLPYYATDGKIIISKINGNNIKGFVHLTLENFRNKKIKISGNFNADFVKE
ncbi:hypothetical protein I2486_08720 [Cellulophaga sp. E16_2]|uniref:Uncharacterized protein n=1 Tax=Cellulophaga algicola (strain DSM 14237 / IC166 / ACAM 630) TaxID=688270 RepID=E6XCP8_CELAD|nr:MULTISPECIES: hypothetical protein [Cellulophaga]ADV49037.1 hypothetical protein Celal_1736 [Cellulophaga algicola DSM 14237]MBO0591490.1 hypothetical protein [Cellulophaga sp. E16_2]